MRSSEVFPLQKALRLKILDLYYKARAGHIGCSLSCIDLLISVLLHHKKPEDRFILSKGHAALALYVCLNHTGEISDAELQTYYVNGTRLPAHPAAGKFAGIPFALGSLGHGFPIACGIAHAARLKKTGSRSFVLMSDGETNEGTTWEAAHFAVRHQLDNLVTLIDKNRIQGFGTLDDVLGDTAAREKWEAIGFEVFEVNGHDIHALNTTLDNLKKNGRPKLIIADTVKGKGVGYMENTVEWHYLPMNEAQYHTAVNDINNSYRA